MGTQVMIVGAGPVGLTLAAELARYGLSIRVVDKAPQRTDKSKALVLWSRTLELMDQGVGSEKFIEAGFPVHAVTFIAGDKQIGRVEMGGVDTPYPYALMIPQSETERLLEERLAELGVVVERAVEVTAIDASGPSVEIGLKDASGGTATMTADWLVGCDGAHSIVRHSLAMPFDGETNDSDWILADARMTGYPVPDTEASVYWHKDGVFVIFPISPGRYRLLADQPPSGAEQPPTPSLEQVQAMIDRRGPSGMRVFDPIWHAGFRINGRKVANYRRRQVFLAGDAAHIHSPAGGQGMNTGMQDAFNLAWKLALVVNGTCGDQLLDSYSPERSQVGDEVLKAADNLTRVGTLRNPVARAIRNMVGHLALGLRAVQHGFADTMTEVSVGYRDTPLNGPTDRAAHAKPGDRLPPVKGQTPAGSGDRPQFRLVAESSPAIDGLVERFSPLLERIDPANGDEGVLLVRPDGYIASTSGDVAALRAYLQGLI